MHGAWCRCVGVQRGDVEDDIDLCWVDDHSLADLHGEDREDLMVQHTDGSSLAFDDSRSAPFTEDGDRNCAMASDFGECLPVISVVFDPSGESVVALAAVADECDVVTTLRDVLAVVGSDPGVGTV